MNLSKLCWKILLSGIFCLSFSTSFAQGCFDLRHLHFVNETGLALSTSVGAQCACSAQNAFNTGGQPSFWPGATLSGRMKGDQSIGCLFKDKFLVVDFFLPTGQKLAGYRYTYTGCGENCDHPFSDMYVTTPYQEFFELRKSQTGSYSTGSATLTLRCKLPHSQQCYCKIYPLAGGC